MGNEIVIPVIEEVLDATRKTVIIGTTLIIKTVQEHEALVEESLLVEEVEIRRVPVNSPVAEAIPIRYEGEKMIVSLLEEVMVVEKNWYRNEELHITKQQVEKNQQQTVLLCKEEVSVEHIDK